MKKIKVAQVLEATVGGTRTHLDLLLTHLDKEKFQVTLFCSTRRCPEFEADLDRLRREGVRVVTVDMVRPLHPWRDPLGCWRLFRHFRRGRFDVVHAHSSKAGGLGRAAARMARVPVVVYTPHAFAFQQKAKAGAGTLYLLLERLARRWTDALVCVSEGERDLAVRRGVAVPGRTFVIPNGVELAAADRHLSAVPPAVGGGHGEVVGCVADLRPQKGLQHLVAAAGIVLRRRPRTTFLLIGSGEMGPALEALIEAHGIGANFKIITAGPPLWEYYARMDVFVLTSLWEGLPYALLEAMAMRRPVVATDVDGSREAVRDGRSGYLVPPGDAEATAAAILRLLEDASLRAAMGAEGRRAVERDYLINRRIRDLEDVYESLHAAACAKLCERNIS